MSTLVVVLLVVPLLAAAATFVVPTRAARTTTAAGVAVALGWVLVASASSPVEVGDLRVDGLAAAAGAGVAVLVASIPSRTWPGAAAGALALAVAPAAAAFDPVGLPDRWLAAAAVALAVLGAAWRSQQGTPRLAHGVALVAGLLLAGGLSVHDPAEATILAAAGTCVAALAALAWVRPGRLLLPLGALAVARTAPLRPPPDGVDWVLVLVAGLLAVGVAVLLLVRSQPAVHRLPLAGVLAAVGLLATDVPELRAAGALLAAGAVLAVAGRHPLALLALAPGLAAGVAAAGLATEPEQALVGAAATAALLAAVTGHWDTAPARPATDARVVAAVAFAVLPVWGWSGADVGDYGATLAVALAVGAVVVVWRLDPGGWSAVRSAVASQVAARVIGRNDGRIVPRLTSGAPHGPALPDVDLVADEAHRKAGDAPPS